MGIVVPFKARSRRHGRASVAGSRACIAASASNVTPSTCRAAARLTISDQNSGGIFPRARQLLTTGGLSASSLATKDVPPKDSIIESAVISGAKIFTFCEYVKLHAKAIARPPFVAHPLPMGKRYVDIGNRLAALREALGISQAELCRQIKCATTRWNQYETGERKITLAVANKLADGYGVTLDWIYRNDVRLLPPALQKKLLGGVA